jgi:cation:H+ antiporter
VPLSTTDLLALLAAIPLAALGGECFLKGMLGLTSWLRLPKFLMATSLAAFATSSPELTVSTMAALEGKPEIGLGDALGGNVVNMALILGLALLFGALPVRLFELRRDFILALFVPILTLMLASDGILSHADGILLLALFIVWLTLIAKQAIGHRQKTLLADTTTCWIRPIYASLLLLAGLACLLLAGYFFVTGASGIATAFGVHGYIIGATLVALGTSLPELVTTLLSRWHGHDDVGLGILLGSNLFNGLAIVGVTAIIHPIHAPFSKVAVALIFGALAVLLILPRDNIISRQRGFGLLAAYMAYVLLTLML